MWRRHGLFVGKDLAFGGWRSGEVVQEGNECTAGISRRSLWGKDAGVSETELMLSLELTN